MKVMICFLPIVLFIATFLIVEGHQAVLSALIRQHLGGVVWGGAGGTSTGPLLLAAMVVMLLAMAQAVWLKAAWRKTEGLWWIAIGLVVLFAAMTLWSHSPAFEKWKPSVLYWAMGTALWISPLLFGKNLLKSLLGERLTLPPKLWHRLNFAWVAFFAAMGLLNLWVAHAYGVDTWSNFKLFGSLGLVLAFTVAQALVLNRYATVAGPSTESR
jgi:intracellular septation protein